MSRKIKCGGNNNINIIGGKNITVDNLEKSSFDQFGRVICDARRVVVRRLPFRSDNMNLVGFMLALLSVLESLASIMSLVELDNYLKAFIVFVGLIGILMMGLVFTLENHKRSLGLSFLGCLEMGEGGSLFLTRVRANCPFCHGRMLMCHGKPYASDHTLVCNRNPAHHFSLDMTTLSDVNEDHAHMCRELNSTKTTKVS